MPDTGPSLTLYGTTFEWRDFEQGIGAVGGLWVQVCPVCHSLVIYHSWAAHGYWHAMQGHIPTDEKGSGEVS